ncbi:MAG: CHASE2 domain-containing protein [Pseudomonadota bacterium]
MSARIKGYRRLFLEWLGITLILLSLAAGSSLGGWLAPLNDAVFDLAISMAARPVPADIVLIAIDDASIAQIGKWPWRRDVHAALIDRLTQQGARAIALDILLTEAAAEPGADLALAQAMRRSGRVILPVIGDNGADGAWQALPPIPQLASAAASLGHIEASLDHDGVMRGYHRFGAAATAPQAHLALQLLALADPARRTESILPQAAEKAQKPWNANSFRRIPFLAPAGSFNTVSYAEVIKGNIAADTFANKIVLVGAFATGMGDSYTVPATRGHGPMAGVEIIANILEGERSRCSIGVLDNVSISLASILLPLIVMLLMPRLSNRNALALVLATLLIALATAIVTPQISGLWWPPAGSLIALLLAYPLWSWRCLEAAQSLIDEELARITIQASQSAQPATRHTLIERMERIRSLRAKLDTAQLQREEALRFISHDLRTPLASLITLMDSATSAPTVGDAAVNAPSHWLTTMRNCADRALAMADDFLRLARAEAISEQHFAACCLLAILDEAIDEFWPQANAKGVTLARHFEVADSEALMMGEASLLHRAFANLLSNAIRHAPPGTEISIGLNTKQQSWLVTITDQGAGIAEDALPALFGRFHKSLHATPGGSDGTGLGLLIVRTVIERHGGSVALSSRVGVGTSFTIDLPRQIKRV